jgi:hypothetical protein
MGLRSTLAVAASASLTGAQDLTTPLANLVFSRSAKLGSGTGAGQADRLFSDRRTLDASATENLDLSGALLDALGGPAAFVRVKGLFISADASNTNRVVFGAASANAWATLLNTTGTVSLPPGASAAFMCGTGDATAWAVTSGTGDILKVANGAGGTPVTYDIVVIGSSA